MAVTYHGRSRRSSPRCSRAIGNGADGLAADDRDCRLEEVPTWTEFELLRDAFLYEGIPTTVCDPRELTFECARGGSRSISSTGAC